MIFSLVSEIKKKRELQELDNSLVEERVKKFLRNEKKTREKIQNARSTKELFRSKEFKELQKTVRKELREIYGVFDLDEKRERKKLLEEVKAGKDRTTQLLEIHQSSKERLPYYNEIYKKIFALTQEPGTLLDLACGANPYSYEFLKCTPFYVGIDLPSEQLKDIKQFFTIKNIDGEIYGIDLVQEQEKLATLLEQFSVDIVFLFKALDSFELLKRHSSKKLLSILNAKWIVVSFPTMSLGGKKHIPAQKRAWFENFVEKEKWEYQTFEIPNEIFYIIKKISFTL